MRRRAFSFLVLTQLACAPSPPSVSPSSVPAQQVERPLVEAARPASQPVRAVDPCEGTDLDILALAASTCVVTRPPTFTATLADLEVLAAPQSSVAPAAEVVLAVSYRNRRSEPIELDVLSPVLHPSRTIFGVTVTDASGAVVSEPLGQGCPLSPSVPARWARLRLLPGGVARAAVPFRATRWRWSLGPDGVAQDGFLSTGCPVRPGAPLASGRYTVDLYSAVWLRDGNGQGAPAKHRLSVEVGASSPARPSGETR